MIDGLVKSHFIRHSRADGRIHSYQRIMDPRLRGNDGVMKIQVFFYICSIQPLAAGDRRFFLLRSRFKVK